MYPSGRWRGYWEQNTWGRQEMHDLVLRFENDRVSGHGVDVIGSFIFAGTYDAQGFMTLTKQYVGQHDVLYQGRYDGEGTILGFWSIGELYRGPFALSPEEFKIPVGAPILSISATPDGDP